MAQQGGSHGDEKKREGVSTKADAQLDLSLLLLTPSRPHVMVPSTLEVSSSPLVILLKIFHHLLGDSKSSQLDHED